MLETFIQIIHVGVALFMILVVLVQGGNQGGVGAAFGGGNSSGVFGATGATTLLGKLTYGAAFIFMLTSITLTVMQGKGGDIGLKEKLKAASESSPSAATKPAATNSNAAETPPAAASAGSEAPADVAPEAPPQAATPAANSPTPAVTTPITPTPIEKPATDGPASPAKVDSAPPATEGGGTK